MSDIPVVGLVAPLVGLPSHPNAGVRPPSWVDDRALSKQARRAAESRARAATIGDEWRRTKADARRGPAQHLDSLDWRAEPPDVVGYWFMRQVGARPFCCWVENLHAEKGGWGPEWSCVPCPNL